MPEPSLHRIRLRAPWQCQFSPRDPDPVDPLPPIEFSIRRSSDWQSWRHLPCPGQLTVGRSFRRPTGLSSSHRVDLIVDVGLGGFEIDLNGQSLTDCRDPSAVGDDFPLGQRYEITSILEHQNRLRIRLDLETSSGLEDWMVNEDGADPLQVCLVIREG